MPTCSGLCSITGSAGACSAVHLTSRYTFPSDVSYSLLGCKAKLQQPHRSSFTLDRLLLFLLGPIVGFFALVPKRRTPSRILSLLLVLLFLSQTAEGATFSASPGSGVRGAMASSAGPAAHGDLFPIPLSARSGNMKTASSGGSRCTRRHDGLDKHIDEVVSALNAMSGAKAGRPLTPCVSQAAKISPAQACAR